MYKVFIEIPKGDDRRRHKSWDGDGMIVDLGPIKNVIPVNNGIMPVHYGFIIGTINKEENPSEELDVLLLSNDETHVAEEIDIVPIALLRREDIDHKIIAVKVGDETTWSDVPEKEKQLVMDYFGYKSPVRAIESAEKAIELIESSLLKD